MHRQLFVYKELFRKKGKCTVEKGLKMAFLAFWGSVLYFFLIHINKKPPEGGEGWDW